MSDRESWIAADRPDLALDEVHVWRIPLQATASRLDRFRESLSPDEIVRADRFRRQLDRERFTIGRGALRERLGIYLGISPDRVAFEYGIHGKPFLVADRDPSPIQFNLAHSGELALLAVSRNRAVGVDLERLRPMLDADRIVARFFTESERLDYVSLADSDRLLAFFLGWTRKEAFLKATGEGIALGLHRVSVSLRPGTEPGVLGVEGRPHESALWSLVDLDPGDGFVGALAVEGERWRLGCFEECGD